MKKLIAITLMILLITSSTGNAYDIEDIEMTKEYKVYGYELISIIQDREQLEGKIIELRELNDLYSERLKIERDTYDNLIELSDKRLEQKEEYYNARIELMEEENKQLRRSNYRDIALFGLIGFTIGTIL